MNRDKTVSVVLAVLLAVSLVFNWRLWQRSAGGDTGAAAATAPAKVEKSQSPPRDRGVQVAFEKVPNPEMKGRLGRIVLTFAEGTKIDGTRTEFYDARGTAMLKTAYGRVAAELVPGNYDLVVCGKKIAGIPVESGKDTRVPSGVLRTHGASDTRFTIGDVASGTNFHVTYGNSEFGLPAGEYEITVGGQAEKFTIEPGKITDF